MLLPSTCCHMKWKQNMVSYLYEFFLFNVFNFYSVLCLIILQVNILFESHKRLSRKRRGNRRSDRQAGLHTVALTSVNVYSQASECNTHPKTRKNKEMLSRLNNNNLKDDCIQVYLSLSINWRLGSYSPPVESSCTRCLMK